MPMPMHTGKQKRFCLSYQGTKCKMQTENLIVFPLPEYQYKNVDMNQFIFPLPKRIPIQKCRHESTHESTCFPLPEYQYKNADMNQLIFPLPIPIQMRTTVREPQGSIGKSHWMITGILSVKAQRKTNKDAR
jgi:hypothetical protein